MSYIRVMNTPQELINRIDELQKQSSFKDRSSFIVDILNQYCLYHSDYYIQSLPDTTRILVEDTLKKGLKSIDQQLQFTLQTNRACVQVMQKLLAVLNGDESDVE